MLYLHQLNYDSKKGNKQYFLFLLFSIVNRNSKCDVDESPVRRSSIEDPEEEDCSEKPEPETKTGESGPTSESGESAVVLRFTFGFKRKQKLAKPCIN